MQLTQDIVEVINSIPWFTQCGVVETIETTLSSRQVGSWADAEKSFSDSSWEVIGTEAQGDLTEYLSVNHADKYQGQWNNLVKQVRPIVNENVAENARRFQKSQGIGPVFVDCVQWDVLNGSMALIYEDCKPPSFYLDVMKIYQSGHFPCGWDGEWPNGSLLYI